jgi:hypothetical protein
MAADNYIQLYRNELDHKFNGIVAWVHLAWFA